MNEEAGDARKLMARLSLIVALAAEFIGLATLSRAPFPAFVLVVSATIFYLAGCEAWSARSPEEGMEAEAEDLRRRGRGIVLRARMGAMGLALSLLALAYLSIVTGVVIVGTTIAVGANSLLLALHAYPKVYPATAPEPPSDPYIESLPAPDDGRPVLAPDITRLVDIKKSLPLR